MKTRHSLRKFSAAFCVCLLGSIAGLWAQGSEALEKANQEYSAEHFREAIKHYQTAVAAGETSAAVFYNLGNAWFRTGDFGLAILSYQRALALEPQHPEAEANLRLARDKARALELKAPWWDSFLGRARADQHTVVAAAAFWLALFCFAGLRFAGRRSMSLVLISLLAFAVFGAALAAAYLRETGRKGRALAIVTAKNVDARVATADSAGTVLTLPPGSEIKILSTRGDWIYAALPNDLRGWIPVGSAERVRL